VTIYETCVEYEIIEGMRDVTSMMCIVNMTGMTSTIDVTSGWLDWRMRYVTI